MSTLENPMHTVFFLSALLLIALPAAAGTSCTAVSGPTRTALLELYTSEGCSSCPPADQWLASLPAQGLNTRAVVPLAFHVDYWDQLGWVDPFAQSAFTQRQRERNATSGWVYTPQFMLNGEDYRPGTRGLQAALSNTPAPARLKLHLDRTDARLWTAQLEASLRSPGDSHQVYVALYENNLVSHIQAGENARRTLHHDFVVRQLTGPFSLAAQGQLQKNLVFTLKPDWKASDLGIAAFIQRADGMSIQALALPACL
jgi:hypothetical protein